MIVLDRVSFGYKRGEDVLKDFSLELPDEGRICLFGKSGCGKSTILRLVMGLSRPGSGRITGTEGLSISAVFQEDRLLPWKTVLENAALFADRDSAEELLTALGLGEVLHSLPAELSGGMKRRAALGRALSHPFDLLILDEPFTGLDEETKKTAIALVDRAVQGRMLLMATHDPEEARALGTEIVQVGCDSKEVEQ